MAAGDWTHLTAGAGCGSEGDKLRNSASPSTPAQGHAGGSVTRGQGQGAESV